MTLYNHHKAFVFTAVPGLSDRNMAENLHQWPLLSERKLTLS